MRRRILWLVTFTWLLCAALIGRLFFLMCAGTNMATTRSIPWTRAVTTRADLQRLLLVETDDGRGRILFRNGFPWSGVWHPLQFGPAADRLYVGVHHEKRQPAAALPLLGQVGLPDNWPDDRRNVPEQGRSGLEYTFDHILGGQRPGYMGLLKDVEGQPQPNMTFEIRPIPGANLRTTVDPLWQNAAEVALQQANVQHGAIVVLNVAADEVLALASRESIHPTENVAVKADVPGSIFKLVTGAAAFESYRFSPDSSFFCKGTVHIPGVDMHCWKVHGHENFMQAIAQSCDVAFANIGVDVQRIGFNTITRRLRLNTPQLQTVDGKTVLPDAEPGVVFRGRGTDAGLLANTAIGQQDVRMTPLQAANLARTIANDGWQQDVQLVRQAERDGRVVRSYSTTSVWQAMSRATASKLKEGMTLAVTLPTGTAHTLAGAGVTVAAKTGTAELPGGRRNGWMVGFAPADRPQIAFCVFAGNTSSPQAHAAVQRMSLQLLGLYRQIHPSHVIS